MSLATFAEDLGHGIGQIRLPLPFSGLKETNAYVIKGASGVTLIDCGVDDGPTRYALEGGLNELGFSLEDVTTLICTHLHPDHMGLAHRLVADGGIELVMHESTGASVERYDDWSILQRRLASLAAEHGAPPDFVARTAAAEPRPDWAGRGVAPGRGVSDGDQVAVDDDRFLEVIYTPGHDKAHICLLDSRTGALFSGDHVLPRITPVVVYGGEEDPLGTYLDSLGRIESMSLGLTYPAHGDILERGSLRARQIILHHERRLGAMIQEVKDQPKTAWQMVGQIFRPHLNTFEQRLALSETLAHLEYLRLRDNLTRSKDSGVWQYVRRSRRSSRT
ncbi:MAG: MBL fold metallo-hydrolase [bacterium]|nr:MBL fold metallo-hydrolase [bacterium]